MTGETNNRHLVSITLDQQSIGKGSPDQEQERAVAIYDLIELNEFGMPGHDGPPKEGLEFDLASRVLALDGLQLDLVRSWCSARLAPCRGGLPRGTRPCSARARGRS